jgi:Leucine-rich repeat (LRR) protein
LTHLPATLAQLDQLEYLIVSNNRLSNLQSIELSASSVADQSKLFISLCTLDIAGNLIDRLPTILFEIRSLQELYVSHNRLTEIASQVGQLKALSTLDLSDNFFTELPVSVRYLQRLERLFLHNNQLHKLPTDLALLNQLTELTVHGNPLVGCSFRSLLLN